MRLRPAERRLHHEERWNAITHGIAAALSVVALIVLVIFAALGRDPLRFLTVTIFGIALVLLYTASACYHACEVGPRKRMLRVLDHALIYVLIAATYTPILLVLLGGPLAWTLVALLWIAATIGIVTKVRNVERSAVRSSLLYIAMGWVGIFAIQPMLNAMPLGCLAWIVAGGIVYTLGVVFYLWEKLPFNHAVWHLFVALGSICHFIAIYWYVLPVAK